MWGYRASAAIRRLFDGMAAQRQTKKMITPDELLLMTEHEKLDLLRKISDAEEWQECFEPIYLKLVDDESEKVRRLAISALGEVADPQHIGILVDKAENDPSFRVRGSAASALGVFVGETLVNGILSEGKYLAIRKFLLDLARSTSEPLFVRRMAIEAISYDPSEEVHDLIDWAYHHPSLEAKMSALLAMGRTQNPRWHDVVLNELDSHDPKLRLEAVNAAAEAGLVKATPKLRNLASGKNKEVRLSAIWALAHTRGPGALETLEMCAQCQNDEVRRTANEAIEEFYSVQRAESEDSSDDSDGEPNEYNY